MKKLYSLLVLIFSVLYVYAQDEFVTVWDLSNAGSSTTSISFNVVGSGGGVFQRINYSWESLDGPSNGAGNISGNGNQTLTLGGLPAGERIRLSIETTYLVQHFIGSSSDVNRIIDVEQWGDAQWTSMSYAFSTCSNLDVSATDVPDLSSVQNMGYMFNQCGSLEGNSTFGNWNTASVTDMTNLFQGASKFNQDIGNWNTSNVESMFFMFLNASSFNQDIGGWSTSNVTSMRHMFLNASEFNQDLGNWDLSSLTDATRMFRTSGMDCSNLAATLQGWLDNPSTPDNVTLGLGGLLYGANAIGAIISLEDDKDWSIDYEDPTLDCISSSDFVTEWNMSTVGGLGGQIKFNAKTSGDVGYIWESVPAGSSGSGTFNVSDGEVTITGLPSSGIFQLAVDYTGLERFYIDNGVDRDRLEDVLQWGTAEWTSMESAFKGCSNLNISATDAPDLSGVTAMNSMFQSCSSLNGPSNIGAWDVSNVQKMHNLFNGASTFNQDISSWITTSANNMAYMFQSADEFNQDISGWSTALVTTFYAMFNSADNFNQNLGSWEIEAAGATGLQFMLNNCGMNCNNYNSTLIGWAANPDTKTGINFLGATGIKYGMDAVDARGELTTATASGGYEWTISGDVAAIDACVDNDAFITVWDLSETGSDPNEISFTITSTSTVNYIWETVPSGTSGSGSLTNGNSTISGLPSNAIVRLALDPDNLQRFYINNGTDKARLVDVEQWGTANWTSMANMFWGASNLEVSATDIPNLSAVTDMQNVFNSCLSLASVPNMNNWSTGSVTNFFQAFINAAVFDEDISGWNVSSATNMFGMFAGAIAFNQDIGSWDVSKVSVFSNMFVNAANFDQDLGDWNLQSSFSLFGMLNFSGLSCENYSATLIGWASSASTPSNRTFGASGLQFGDNAQDAFDYLDVDLAWNISGTTTSNGSICLTGDYITEWDLSQLGTGSNDQLTFNIDLGGTVKYSWKDLIGGTNGSGEFTTNGAQTISGLPTNGNIRLKIDAENLQHFYISNGADQSRLTEVEQWGAAEWFSMEDAFYGCENLQVTATDIPDIDFVTNVDQMFRGCSALTGPSNIGSWDVGQVQFFRGVFYDAALFNQNISNWDVGQAEDMTRIFSGAENFNQDLGNWDVKNVEDMQYMFYNAFDFDQYIGDWNVAAVNSMFRMFSNASSFNQYLGDWQLKTDVILTGMLSSSGLDCENYSATLIAWADNPSIPTGRTLGATNLEYGLNAADARTYLIDNKGWSFVGDDPSGVVCVIICPFTTTLNGESSVCEDDTLLLWATTSVAGDFNFKWIAPDAFTVFDDTLQRLNATPAMEGLHTMVVSYRGCWDTTFYSVDVIDNNVDFADVGEHCDREPNFLLTEGTPAGGTYTSPFVSANSFYPASATAGTHRVYYTENVSGCSFVDSTDIVVNEYCNLVWDGEDGNGLWSTAQNWRPDVEPLAGDSAYMDHTYVAGSYQVSVKDHEAVDFLKIAANATLLVEDNASITVHKRIENSGDVEVENEGSFIQPLNSTLSNSGTMKHTKVGATGINNFTYWSSPITTATMGVRGGATEMLEGKIVYAFKDGENQREDYVKITTPSGNMVVGRGYALNDSRSATFTGTFNNGDVLYPLTLNAAPAAANPSYNLIGNPYPSSIHAATFIAHNGPSSLDVLESGIIYIFDQCNASVSEFVNSDEFIAISAAGTTTSCPIGNSTDGLNKTHIPSAQGFFVEAKIAGTGTLEFDNSMRSEFNSVLKSGDKKVSKKLKKAGYPSDETLNSAAKIYVKLFDENKVASTTLISMLDDATNGHDFWYDARAVGKGNIPMPAIYSDDLEGLKHQIQGVPELTEPTRIIPLSALMEQGKPHTMSFETVLLEEKGYYGLLHDKLLQKYHVISNGEYTFTATDSITSVNRFEIMFMQSISTDINDYTSAESTKVYYSGGQLHIIGQVAGVKVLDVLGKELLQNNTAVADEVVIPLNLPTGIYLIQTKTATGLQTTRVFVD